MDSMHTRLSRKALERAFRDLPFDANMKRRIVEHLPKQAIITPFPDYGCIVHDVDNTYEFPDLRRRMDGESNGYADFFSGNLLEYFFHASLDTIPENEAGPDGFFWKNGFFGGADARALYAILAWANPETFLEVGVGNSTRIARKAIREFGLRTRIRSIDPSPRASVDGYSDEVLLCSVTGVSVDEFAALEPGDILFIDGSHVCNVGTDVPFLFLNVLPVLKPGVIVHVHDIFLPWEYSEPMRLRHYNEQHVLGAILANSSSWEIVAPICYMSRTGLFPEGTPGGGSFWIRKTMAR